ncbi:MAG: VacJ family lipoprotein [Rhodobacteraceae bacterium]|nr:VacJ family lipoprotein [Paracoccaceae bacterium]
MILVLLAGMAGCARAPAPAGTNDPFEATNRLWFERNLALTSAVTGERTSDSDPDAAVTAPRRHPFRRAVANFGGNLGLPSTILNDLLQLRPDHAFENTFRMLINTTIGIGGLFDPAGRMGLHGRSSDFGETLHRWGVAEGAYVVLPLAGPSTERDAAGMVVDMAINPLRFLLPQPEASWSSAARIAGRIAEASEYSDLLDANVINTADPYAQARLLYLQTRRYHLGIETEDEIIDPYAEY